VHTAKALQGPFPLSYSITPAYMAREVYFKEGDAYILAGCEWNGFPADGVWLVQDGAAGLISKITDVPTAIEVAKLERCRLDMEIKVASIMALWRQGEALSAKQLVNSLFEVVKEHGARHSATH
jgi:hypothetical protein